MRGARIVGATLCLLLAGCPVGGPRSGPCRADPLRCGNGGEFNVDESCELEGELEVELGHGEDAFTPFAEAPPTLHRGFQGGQHVFLGVRVALLALDRYDRVQIALRAWTQGRPWEPPCGADEADCPEYPLGDRIFVAGDERMLSEVGEGRIEEVGYTLVLGDWTRDRPVWFEATVTDPCGRVGRALAEVPRQP